MNRINNLSADISINVATDGRLHELLCYYYKKQLACHTPMFNKERYEKHITKVSKTIKKRITKGLKSYNIPYDSFEVKSIGSKEIRHIDAGKYQIFKIVLDGVRISVNG